MDYSFRNQPEWCHVLLINYSLNFCWEKYSSYLIILLQVWLPSKKNIHEEKKKINAHLTKQIILRVSNLFK